MFAYVESTIKPYREAFGGFPWIDGCPQIRHGEVRALIVNYGLDTEDAEPLTEIFTQGRNGYMAGMAQGRKCRERRKKKR
jgi:hypothetical protein